METPSAYIPMDRRQAMAKGALLPDRTGGAALFADISGFTPLTEVLLKEYGPKRGAEELTRQLNRIYDALVTVVHRYGGSVIAFSGDAITCWFDDDSTPGSSQAGWRAIVCSLSMQQAMVQFAAIKLSSGQVISLAMKVAVAAGPARRFQLGDPQIQIIDTLAGATLDEMAEAESYAQKNEIILSRDLIAHHKDRLAVAAWRQTAGTGKRFGVIAPVLEPDQIQEAAIPWPALALEALTEEQVRPWVLPPIYDRLRLGSGHFLAELRPAVILFLYFDGIDYDEAGARGKLDAYVRWVQTVLARYEGYIFQLTIGDKGSYLYTAFGAPITYGDDARRAVSAALDLQSLPAALDYIGGLKIGLSQGQIYAGAYGGSMRRTYGVLGDEVNLAARLMQAAEPGQILVSEYVRQAAGDNFTWDPLPAISVKGKAAPIQTFTVKEVKVQSAIYLPEVEYALPVVGRRSELRLAAEKMDEVSSNRGQVIGVTAEAGLGKSRLIVEIIRLALERGLLGYGGECQSYGVNTSYLVWEPIWRGFFGLDPTAGLADQVTALENRLEQLDPSLQPRLPLLGSVLNLSIPDNDLTQSFDPKLRKTSLEALLVDCLRARAEETPLLFVLEDCHWLDPLSHDLLAVVGQAIADLPVLLLLAYRPLHLTRLQEIGLEKLPHFIEIELSDFSAQEAEELIRLKLDQIFGRQPGLSSLFFKRIIDRAQGNPFYIEELLNYLHDQKIGPHDTHTLERLDLPTSLHSLVLSRIDQLTDHQKNTIKLASVIGRSFRAAWLWGMYPDLGPPEQVKSDLEALHRLDLTPLDRPEPELIYMFKHIFTQEVAYESLPYATRAVLHNYLGQFIELNYSDRLNQFVNLLAFHYERSENVAKKREYLRRAGEASQEKYANEAALDYYRQVLPLLAPAEEIAVRRKVGDTLQLLGRWQEAGEQYQSALQTAEQLADQAARAWCETAMGQLLWRQGLFAEATAWLDRARGRFEALQDQAGVGQILHYKGTIAAQQGDLETARSLWETSLAIRQTLEDRANIANLLNNLAIVARNQGQRQEAQTLHEQALALRYELGDKRAIAVSLNNLGRLLTDMGEYDMARMQLEVAVDLQREIGDKWELANALHTLANVIRSEGNYPAARAMYTESLTTLWALNERWMLAYVLEDMGGLAALQGEAERALRLVGAAAALREATGSSPSPTEQDTLEALLRPARQALGEAATAAAEAAGRAMALEDAVAYARGEARPISGPAC